MIRIDKARVAFRGWRGSRDRAAAIGRDAMDALAQDVAPAQGQLGRVQVVVRVAPGTSDAQIASRVASAVRRRLPRGEGG